jgi:hypothetical protein
LRDFEVRRSGSVVAVSSSSSSQNNARCRSSLQGRAKVSPGLGPEDTVAAGYSHTCAVKADGELVCFGDDEVEQCHVPPGLWRGTVMLGRHPVGQRPHLTRRNTNRSDAKPYAYARGARRLSQQCSRLPLHRWMALWMARWVLSQSFPHQLFICMPHAVSARRRGHGGGCRPHTWMAFKTAYIDVRPSGIVAQLQTSSASLCIAPVPAEGKKHRKQTV